VGELVGQSVGGELDELRAVTRAIDRIEDPFGDSGNHRGVLVRFGPWNDPRARCEAAATRRQQRGNSTQRTFAAQLGGNGTVHPVTGDTWTVSYTTGGVARSQSGTF
jgi:hypothetical protein